MVTTILLIIIYLAFVSLGLPDGFFGVAWPEMRQTFSMPLAGAGYLTTISTIGSVISSFTSGHILKKLGTGPVVCISCALTGLAFLGYGLSNSFYFLMLLCIPLGFGAGAVDAGLNNYVSTHLTSQHMNWLHASWGLGALIGPVIMTNAIVRQGSWRYGYIEVAVIQLSLATLFLFTLRIWKKKDQEISAEASRTASDKDSESAAQRETNVPAMRAATDVEKDFRAKRSLGSVLRGGFARIFHHKGLLYAMLVFLFYVGSEASVGLWSASYLRTARNVSVEDAGLWVSVYYGGITAGRILIGFIVEKIGTKTAVRIGMGVSTVGFLLLFLPFGTSVLCPVGLGLIGLGFAPIFPCVMQDTPVHFGKDFSRIAIGYQMGMSNIGYTFLPILIGAISGATTLWFVPFGALLLFVLFIFAYEKLTPVRPE